MDDRRLPVDFRDPMAQRDGIVVVVGSAAVGQGNGIDPWVCPDLPSEFEDGPEGRVERLAGPG